MAPAPRCQFGVLLAVVVALGVVDAKSSLTVRGTVRGHGGRARKCGQ
jgi:hypothetical protein